MVGGEHSLKISDPWLLRLGIEGVLKIFREKGDSVRKLMNVNCVSRTAPATPGLLKMVES